MLFSCDDVAGGAEEIGSISSGATDAVALALSVSSGTSVEASAVLTVSSGATLVVALAESSAAGMQSSALVLAVSSAA